MSITADQITTALKKLGPSGVTVIANELGADPSAVSYHLRRLAKDKAIIATGATSSRRYSLPGQKIDGQVQASPARESRKHKRRKARGNGHAPKAESTFIPAVDADSNLLLITDAGVQRFTEKQSMALAQIVFTHFED